MFAGTGSIGLKLCIQTLNEMFEKIYPYSEFYVMEQNKTPFFKLKKFNAIKKYEVLKH